MDIMDSMHEYLDDMKIDKESLKNKDCNLVNLAMALKLVFDQLEAAQDANLVLAVGNTGCGKSTMLSSLVYGPGHLSVTVKNDEIDTAKGKKIVKRKVIEQSNELRQKNIFKVGHSQAVSETFIPQFV